MIHPKAHGGLTVYLVHSLIIALSAALWTSLLTIFVTIWLLSYGELIYFPRYGEYGLYVDPAGIRLFWASAGLAVVIAALTTRRVLRLRWRYLLPLGGFALLVMYHFDWSEFYDNDIIFSQWYTANYAILMGPIAVFSLIAAFVFQIFAPARAYELVAPLGAAGAFLAVLTVLYFAAIFAALWIIATQRDWTDLFRFSSRFDGQGRGY